MFTIEQIENLHSKVKSGADFPHYVQSLIGLGILKYDVYVKDGYNLYFGKDNFRVASEATYSPLEVAPTGNKQKLEHTLKIHQQGQTDYLTFCAQAAEAGVEKWTVDTILMTCTYFDKQGHALVEEKIPGS